MLYRKIRSQGDGLEQTFAEVTPTPARGLARPAQTHSTQPRAGFDTPASLPDCSKFFQPPLTTSRKKRTLCFSERGCIMLPGAREYGNSNRKYWWGIVLWIGTCPRAPPPFAYFPQNNIIHRDESCPTGVNWSGPKSARLKRWCERCGIRPCCGARDPRRSSIKSASILHGGRCP